MTLPSEMTCNKMFVASESNRLMSSTYNTPRCALASNPGWNTLLPVFTDSSTSMEPSSMSSMTFRGICTKGARTISLSKLARRSVTVLLGSAAISASSFFRSWESISPGFSGSTLYFESLTSSIGGNKACKARAMTDLAVPRPPEIKTPPMSRLTLANSNAVLMESWPTTIDKGKPSCAVSLAEMGVAASCASAAAMRSSGVIVAFMGLRLDRGACGAR